VQAPCFVGAFLGSHSAHSKSAKITSKKSNMMLRSDVLAQQAISIS